MARLDMASLATGGLSSAVGSVVVKQVQAMLPPETTTMGNILCYAVPIAAGVGGAYISSSARGGMVFDIGQGVHAAGFTLLGMKLAQKML